MHMRQNFTKPLNDSRVAVAYLRLSPREASDARLGLEAQRAAIAAWAARQNAVVVAAFADVDTSGDTPIGERAELQLALEAVRVHKAGVLVVAKRDRLARDPVESALLTRAARSAGAAVRSADGVASGDTAADDFVAAVVDAAAAYELAQIRARTVAALAAKRARGEATGGAAPYGWRRSGPNGKLVPVPSEQHVIVQARALRDQKFSIRAICYALTKAGYFNRLGKPFMYESIRVCVLGGRLAHEPPQASPLIECVEPTRYVSKKTRKRKAQKAAIRRAIEATREGVERLRAQQASSTTSRDASAPAPGDD